MERCHLCHVRIVCDSLAAVLRSSRLRHSDRVEEGDWIISRLAPFASGVSAIVPGGFEAYIRVLHPVPVVNAGPVERQEHVTWGEVAHRTGATMHPLAQYEAIAGMHRSPRRERAGVSEPPTGELDSEVLKVLCAVLARHTSTPERCWFALWEGYGWIQGSPAIAMSRLVQHAPPRDTRRAPYPSFTRSALPRPPWGRARPPTAPGDPGYVPPAFPPDVIEGPRFRLPQRDYFLFEGPLDGTAEMGWTSPGGHFLPQSPNIFWPDDRAWCVATEIDLDSTYVGGSEALARALLAEPRLETWRVEPAAPITAYSDSINPLEGSRYDAPPRHSMRSPPALLRLVARAFGRLRAKHK